MKRLLSRSLKLLFVLAALLLAAGWYLYTRDYHDYFLKRKGSLTTVEEERSGTTPAFAKSWLKLRNDAGFTVNCGLLAPTGKGRTYPAIILLGGKATGKYAIDYALDIEGVIIVAVDYPYEPRETYTPWNFVYDLPAIRRALIDMMPSAMLVTDYLWQRPDVDTSRIVLLGYSFGAPFVPCVMANDRRPAAAAMVYGGGDLHSLISHNVARYEGATAGTIVGFLSGVLLHPVEPLRFAPLIAPAPLVMINGTNDEQVPRRNAELLFAAAREPKKQIWLESRHVNPKNVDLTKQIVATLKSEFTRLGILPGVHAEVKGKK
jgi:hypothetical protein